MNKPTKMADMKPAGVSPEEWQARVDLAAVYRLTAHYGWDDVIYNHSSMRVPGEPRNFLMKKHELLYTEVTASNLVKVNMDQDLDEKSGVNRPGFTLHGGVFERAAGRQLRGACAHRNRHGAVGPQARLAHGVRSRRCASTSASAITSMKASPRTSTSASASTRTLGQNRALILQHHGMLTVGKTAREAFVLMKYLLTAAEIQLRMEATGGELLEIPAEVCAKVAEQFQHHDIGRGSADWPAYLRVLDGIDPSYRD